MKYDKTIVCLARSRKFNGTCVAGKEKTKSGFGPWIRPISSRPTGELFGPEMQYFNGNSPQLLDLIEIILTEHRPTSYQSENHVIDDKYYWYKRGQLKWPELESIRDNPSGRLWIDGYHSYNGVNDRIPERIADEMKDSLCLVKAENMNIFVSEELGGLKVRAQFSLNNNQYRLVVTDPEIERFFQTKGCGDYPSRETPAFLCVSLGEPYRGYCYKLVASIFVPNLARYQSE